MFHYVSEERMNNTLKSTLYTTFSGILGILLACHISNNYTTPSLAVRTVQTVEDLVNIFPRSQEEAVQRTDAACKVIRKAIDNIIALPDSKRTFTNTIKAYDTTINYLRTEYSILNTLLYLSQDKAIRTTCQDAINQLKNLNVEVLDQNASLYKALKAYKEGARKHETLDTESNDYLNEILKSYKDNGLDLPIHKRLKVQKLKKRLGELKTRFGSNISEDAGQRHICVPESQLTGLSPDFIESLKKTPDGLCKLGVDYPTCSAVFENCAIESTRKSLWQAYSRRAYPLNEKVLQEMREVQEDLAHILGYKSAAHYELEGQMAQSPEHVEKFLHDMDIKTFKGAYEQVELYKANLPEGVTLTDEGSFKPWDWEFIKNVYRKKHYNFDNQMIAEYFPIDHTIKALLELYESFFDIELKQVDASLPWNKDTTILEAHERDSTLLGYIILDLFPRPGKYSHACHIPVIHPIKDNVGKTSTSVGFIVANFPSPHDGQSSLLTHKDVITFFHEFGHAIHTLFSNTKMAQYAGTHTKIDFVEMPSQMLEEWMWDKQTIKRISKHYKTGLPLPDTIIDAMIGLKNSDYFDFMRRQLIFAETSLQLFKGSSNQSAQSIILSMHQKYCPYKQSSPEEHFECSFLHLGVYGSRYYGYAWAKAHALDLFKYIQEQGLSAHVGKRYRETVLSKGGSKHPEELLHAFLNKKTAS